MCAPDPLITYSGGDCGEGQGGANSSRTSDERREEGEKEGGKGGKRASCFVARTVTLVGGVGVGLFSFCCCDYEHVGTKERWV